MRHISDSIVKEIIAEKFISIESYCAQLSVNTNPYDDEDKALIQAAKSLTKSENKDAKAIQLEEFIDRMALLLKHDWDRAKNEAHPWSFFCDEPKRILYSEFKKSSSPFQSFEKSCRRKQALFLYFLGLFFSAGIIFFLAAGLIEPFQKLVKLFNNPDANEATGNLIKFIFLSISFGLIWSLIYLFFKGCEKRFLEIWFKK